MRCPCLQRCRIMHLRNISDMTDAARLKEMADLEVDLDRVCAHLCSLPPSDRPAKIAEAKSLTDKLLALMAMRPLKE